MSKSFDCLICIFFTIAMVFAIKPYTKEEKSCNSCKYDFARPLIVNGKSVTRFHKYPFLVALVDVDNFIYCGGMIISSTFILTASHCVYKKNMKKEKKCQISNMPKECFIPPDTIRVGYLNDSRKSYVIKRKISRIIPHPNYHDETLANDITLIELDRPLVCLDLPRPICLSPKNLSKVGNELVIAGWGARMKNEIMEDFELKEGMVTQIEPSECADRDRHEPEQIVCADWGKSGQDICNGDSGSPAFMLYKRNYYAVGVASASICGTEAPSIFVEVYAYMDWIKSIVKNLPTV